MNTRKLVWLISLSFVVLAGCQPAKPPERSDTPLPYPEGIGFVSPEPGSTTNQRDLCIEINCQELLEPGDDGTAYESIVLDLNGHLTTPLPWHLFQGDSLTVDVGGMQQCGAASSTMCWKDMLDRGIWEAEITVKSSASSKTISYTWAFQIDTTE